MRVESPAGDVEASAGHLWVLTHERHSVHAVEDSVFLLTTLTGRGPAVARVIGAARVPLPAKWTADRMLALTCVSAAGVRRGP